jgi:hypothetical protein
MEKRERERERAYVCVCDREREREREREERKEKKKKGVTRMYVHVVTHLLTGLYTLYVRTKLLLYIVAGSLGSRVL